MSKGWETLACDICRSWCGLLWNLELFWNLQKSSVFFFISSDCGFHFYCKPMFCVESVMDCSLICYMACCLDWQCVTFLSFLFHIYYVSLSLVESLLTRIFFIHSVVLCSLLIMFTNMVLLAYMHCRNKRTYTLCQV